MPGTSAPLIGRESELSSLTAWLESAAEGDPSVVVVGGDAGVGKTRLVREAAARAETAGWTILTGGCVQLAEGAAVLAPVAEILRQLAHDRGDDAVAGLLDGPARWLAPLVPELGVDTVELDDAPATQVLVSFHRLLRDLADERPVLLVLEDLHWADATTRDLLRQLTTRLRDERLLVVATVRTDDLDRRHPLRLVLAEVVRRPEVMRIDLAPLTHEQVVALLTAIVGEDHEQDLAAIANRAAGNPFYAEQLLSMDDGGLPRSLEDALLARLERLPGNVRQLLGEAAVLGSTIDPTLLETLTQLDRSAARSALRAALDDGVLVVDGAAYAFRHALLREVALEQLLPNERVAAHAAAAAALEADPALAVVGRAGVHGQAAHHWWEARDLPRCLAASVAATGEARAVSASAAALRHARRAIELWDRVDDPEQLTGTTYPALLLSATNSAADVDDPSARELGSAAIRAAEEAGDATARATATMKVAMRLLNTSRELDALEVTTAELARHGTDRTEARSIALSSHAAAVASMGEFRTGHWDLEGVADDASEALAMAREHNDGFAEYRALLFIAQGLGPYLPDRYEEPVERLLSLVGHPGIDDTRHATHFVAATVPSLCGEIRNVERELARWQKFASTTSTPRRYWVTMWSLSVQVDTWSGRIDKALQRIEEVDVRDHLDNHASAAEMALAPGEALRWTGFTPRAMDRAELVFGAQDARWRGVHVVTELAASRAAAGATPRDVLDAVVGIGESWGDRGWHAAVPKLVAAVAVAANDLPIDDDLLAETDHAIDRLAGFVDWLRDDAPIRPWADACLQRARAERAFLAGEPDPALWDPVVADFEARGGLPHAALARLRRATAHASAEGGASPACEADLFAAWEVFSDLGLTALQDDALALARRLRVNLPGRTDDSEVLPDLTDREREVLSLVAEGWTNKRVGEHLFISPKTVSVHMSNTIRKLDVDSRTEAIAVAHRAGLLPDD